MNQGTLFAEAMHVSMLRRMRLIRAEDRAEARKRILIAVLLGWVPLAALSIGHVLVFRDRTPWGFFSDAAVHARLLLAVPLLIAAEYIVLPRLESIGRHFAESTLIAPSQRVAFNAWVLRLRKASAGIWPSATLLVVVYALVGMLAMTLPNEAWPDWQRSTLLHGLSLAGWWHLLISLPLLLGLVLAWLWRLGIWVRFLFAMSRTGLCLIASHPDGAAGLRFVAFSPRIFTPVSLAIGIVVAGTLANKVLHLGMTPIGHEATPLLTALTMVIVFASPPLLFSRALIVAWRSGVFRYGDLANRLGAAFEEKWLPPGPAVDASALGEPDFSATTDLFAVAANVYGMRLILIDYQGIAVLAMAAIVPFAPIWLSAIPLATIVGHVVDILF